MHQPGARKRLHDGRRRGEQPVGEDHAAGDHGDRVQVVGPLRREQVERRAEPGAEEHGRGQDVQPLYDEVFHRRASSVYSR